MSIFWEHGSREQASVLEWMSRTNVMGDTGRVGSGFDTAIDAPQISTTERPRGLLVGCFYFVVAVVDGKQSAFAHKNLFLYLILLFILFLYSFAKNKNNLSIALLFLIITCYQFIYTVISIFIRNWAQWDIWPSNWFSGNLLAVCAIHLCLFRLKLFLFLNNFNFLKLSSPNYDRKFIFKNYLLNSQ